MKHFLIIIISTLFYTAGKTQVIRSSRDQLLRSDRALLPLSAGGQIDKVSDLSEKFPPPSDQCKTNSCVSFACTYYLFSYLYSKDKNLNFNYLKNGTVDDFKVFSPFYSFYYNKNSSDCYQCSSSVFQTLQFLKSNGSPFLHYFKIDPCVENNCNSVPDQRVIDSAYKNKIRNFAWIYSDLKKEGNKPSDLLKRFLFLKYPIIVIVDVDEGFQKLENKDPGYIYNSKSKKGNNWHAMVCTGYDIDHNALRFINSYNLNWGFKDKMWISSDYIDEHIGEAYVVNVDKNLLVPSNIFFSDTIGTNIFKPNYNIVDFYDQKFEQLDDIYMSAKVIPKGETELRIIVKGADSIYYLKTEKLNREAKKIMLKSQPYIIKMLPISELKNSNLYDSHIKIKLEHSNN